MNNSKTNSNKKWDCLDSTLDKFTPDEIRKSKGLNKIPTGFTELDDILGGGIPYNSLTVLENCQNISYQKALNVLKSLSLVSSILSKPLYIFRANYRKVNKQGNLCSKSHG